MGIFQYPPCVWSAGDIHIWCLPNLPRSNYMNQYLLSLSVQIQYLKCCCCCINVWEFKLSFSVLSLGAACTGEVSPHAFPFSVIPALGWEMWGSFSVSNVAQMKRQVPLLATSSHLFLCSPKVHHGWCYCSALNQKSHFFSRWVTVDYYFTTVSESMK